MHKLILAVFLIGCGDGLVVEASETLSSTQVVSGKPPLKCWLDADRYTCHCELPVCGPDSLQAMYDRCNFLRSLDVE